MSHVDEAQIRDDSMYNALVGLGKEADKGLQSVPAPGYRLTDVDLSNIWEFNGLGATICEIIPEDATRNWFTIPADTDGAILKELERINAKGALTQAAVWARLYGGAMLVAGYADNQKLQDPRTAGKNKIEWLKTFSSARVHLTGMELDMDPKSPRFETPVYYPVRLLTGSIQNIHHTRCQIIPGLPVADDYTTTDFRRRYWGMSVLQPMYQRLAGLSSAAQGLDSLLLEFTIGVFKVNGLAQLVANGQGDKVQKRISLINMSKSILRSVLLDKDEEFRRETASLAGVDSTIDRVMLLLSSVSRIPVTRLFGRSPSGLNATGESDIRLYHETVANYQQQRLTPALMPIIRQINDYLGVGLKEADLMLEWNSPLGQSEQEKVTMRKTQADIDNIYLTAGVVTPSEVRQSRFGGRKYSIETEIEEGSEAPGPETDPDLDQGESGNKPTTPKK